MGMATASGGWTDGHRAAYRELKALAKDLRARGVPAEQARSEVDIEARRIHAGGLESDRLRLRALARLAIVVAATEATPCP